MKKVLYIGTTNIYGGVGHIMFELCKNINRDAVQFDFLYYEEPTEDEMQIIHDLGAKFYKVPRYSRNPIQFMKILKNFYKTHKYDVIHLHASTAMLVLYTFPVWNKSKVNIVYHSHVEAVQGIGNRFLHNILRHIVISKTQTRLAVSEEAAKFMFGKKRSSQVTILKNGLELNKYEYSEQSRIQIRNKLGIEKQYVIGNVGRFSYAKNHSFIIDVFEKVCEYCDNAVLLLVGNGEDEVTIRQLVERKELVEKVIFYGVTKQVGEVLCAMDCFLFPSHFEGLGIVALEAQMNGLPVIASEHVPMEAKVSSNYVTMSLTQNSLEEWAKQVLVYRDSSNARHSHYNDLTQHGYNIQEVCKQLERIYLED